MRKTMAKRSFPLWFVWAEEYPDEGSEVVAAFSRARALEAGRRIFGLCAGASPVTPDDIDELRTALANAESEAHR